MKITIDTKEDSPADIRKVIALLSKMIEGSVGHHSNIFEDSSPSLGGDNEEPVGGTNAFANMFGGDSESKIEDTPVLNADPEEETEEEKEDAPQMIEY